MRYVATYLGQLKVVTDSSSNVKMGDIQRIVQALKQPPFHLDLSLVSFSRKSPHELRQLLNDVFAAIDKKQARDLRDEQREETSARMVEFVRMLKYRPLTDGIAFRQGMVLGSPEAIYPLLSWMLPQISMLQKRAYLAQFLTDVEVPEELLLDEEVQELHTVCKGLQEQFKEKHRQVESLRRSKLDPVMVKDQISDLEGEREQLVTKISKIKGKLQAVPKMDELLGIALHLRRQMQEETQLAESISEQHAALAVADAKHVRLLDKLRDMRANVQSGSSVPLFQQLFEETSLLQYAVKDKLPKENQIMKVRLQSMQSVLNEPIISEQDLVAIQEELYTATADLTSLMERRNKERAAVVGSDGLRGMIGGGEMAVAEKEVMYRQQAQLASHVAKKREAMFANLEALLEHKRSVLRELDEKTLAVDEGKTLRGEDYNIFSASVKHKLVTYKRMKRDLELLTTELGTLSRTKDLLVKEDAAVQNLIADLECKRGIAGFMTTEGSLETVVAAASVIDAQKGTTLEEISKFVTEINSRIKDHRTKLAPQVKELRARRASAKELEVQRLEKKPHYDELVMILESQQAKLEMDVVTIEEEYQGHESQYHFINCTSRLIDITSLRAMEEHGAGGKGMASLGDKYRARINLQEEMTKSLRDRQRKIKEMEVPNQEQMAMLKDLRSLLEVKVNLHSDKRCAAPGLLAVELQEMGGANRLVLSCQQ